MKIRINTHDLSLVFWREVFSAAVRDEALIHKNLKKISQEQAVLISEAQVFTGSVGDSTMWCLYGLARTFDPQCVVEVGTYIGNSTRAIAHAMELSTANSKRIYTCDVSNDIDIVSADAVKISQYRKKSSTEMLADLVKRNETVDMFFIDGRLAAADIPMMIQVARGDAVYILDDFEGVEKGVVNALGISEFLSKTHVLIYPPDKIVLASYGLKDRGIIAAWVPRSIFVLSRQ